MKNLQRFTAPIALTLIVLAAGAATATEGVSPGAVDRMAKVNNPCPTFSWGAVEATDTYEIVAYELPEGAVQGSELSSEQEVLYTRVTGSATGWTPSSDRCFAPGGRYVWFVRAVIEMIDDQVIEAAEWSAGRYFEVPPGPSVENVARAVEVLKQWEAANGGGSLMLSSAAASVPVPVAAPDADSGTGSSHPKSVPTAAAAIRGQHPDTSGEAYGVVGTSASADGAGVAAANLDGGPDLVLDGLTHGETDTALSEAGIDRASVNSEVFEVKNSGPGGMRLSVEGEIAATALDCPNCVDSVTIADGSIIDNDLADDAVTEEKIEHGAVGTSTLQNNSVTSAKIADGAVGTVDLADGSVATVDLVDGSVTAAKIAGGAVDETALRNNAVTTGKIADGTIVQADLALSSVSKNNIQNDAVVSGKILDGTIGSADLSDNAVTGAKIADGTIASADIGSSQVSSTHILNMGVDTADLATGAVTSTKIEDGTITAADVATDGGVYSTRGALYRREYSVVVSAGSSGSAESACDDLNDLPLQGGCRTSVGSNVHYLQDAYFANWSDPSISPTFSCTFVNNGVDDLTAYVSMVCVSVPGLL